MAAYDWQAIERDWRLDKFTDRELAATYGPSHVTIFRRAKREGWTKDLREAVRQATNAKLIEEAAHQAAQQAAQQTQHATQQEAQQAGERAQQSATLAVLGAAELNKQVILAHRSRAKRAAEVTAGLLEELALSALMAEESDMLEKILAGGEEASAEDQAKAKQVVRKALDVGARANTVKSIIEALAKVQAMERQAYNLDTQTDQPDDEDQMEPREIARRIAFVFAQAKQRDATCH